MHYDAELFVAIGFVIFLGVLGWAGGHKKLLAAVDQRVSRIRSELAEAQRLRAEAEALHASFERKRAEAELEAEAIIAQARSEAELLAKEARQRLDDYVGRRMRQVEEKIALAETQAAAEVRARAADLAVLAAEGVLRKGVPGADFVAAGVEQVKALARA